MNGVVFDSKSIVDEQKEYLQLNRRIDEAKIENIDILNSIFTVFADSRITAAQGMCVIENKYICVCYYLSENTEKKVLMIYDLENQIIASTTEFYKENSSSDSGTNVNLGHVNSLSYYNGHLYIPNGTTLIELNINITTFDIQFSRNISIGYSQSSAVVCEEGVYVVTTNYNNRSALLKLNSNFSSPELMYYLDGIFNEGDVFQGLDYDGEYFYFAISTTAKGIGSDSGTPNWSRYGRETVQILDKYGNFVKYLHYARGEGCEIEDVSILKKGNQRFLFINPNVDNETAMLYIHQLDHTEYTPQYLRARCISHSPLWANHTNHYCIQPKDRTTLKDNDPWATGTDERPLTNLAQIQWLFMKKLTPPITVIKLNSGHYSRLSFLYYTEVLLYMDSNVEIDHLYISGTTKVTIAVTGGSNHVIHGIQIINSGILNIRGSTLDLVYDSSLSQSTTAITNEFSFVIGYFKSISGFTRSVYNNVGSTIFSAATYDSLTSNKSGLMILNGVIQNSIAT